LAALLAAQLHAKNTFHLSQDQIVRDAASGLVISHNLLLLADFLEEIRFELSGCYSIIKVFNIT